MAHLNKAHQKEVKLEELLRMKRAEKPDKAFWSDFDRELHQRMLRTLVRKDPWYIQLLRALSGRISQTTAVVAAAAVVAMMVVRPAFVDATNPAEPQLAVVASPGSPGTPGSFIQSVEVAMSDLDAAVTPDYQLESISPVSDNMTYTPDYSLDGFEVASYDIEAYTSDAATFAVAGVVTGFVY
ncbi:MAG: hypothetical protein ACPGGN_04110 [Opitutales bacterium]